jgi:regulator of cell morphogenesis and NO signaling
MLDPRQTVADLVLDHSECAAVFQRHRIDFCCRGELSIAEAAAARGIEAARLVAELAEAIAARRGTPPGDPRELSTAQLIAYIVAKHHAYLRGVLPHVQALAAKVSRVHGEHVPALRDLAAAVEALVSALIPHLDEEEQVLFPALTAVQPDPATIAPQLAAMLDEHRAVAELLARIRGASDDFTPPDWACNSYRTLFSELRQLEADVFTHVHLENHVLRPRFAAAGVERYETTGPVRQ